MSKLSDNERLCKFFGLLCIHTTVKWPDYTSDLTLWDAEAYKAIEDGGLRGYFKGYLEGLLYRKHGRVTTWEACQATPAQKTKALSRALQEMEGKG